MRILKAMSALALGAVLGCGEDVVDPGNPDEQSCTGQISGLASGVLESCTLEAYRNPSGRLHHDFRFKVRWSSGEVTEGGITMHRDGEPATGQFGMSGFEVVSGDVAGPNEAFCSLSAGMQVDHGSMMVRVNDVPKGQDMAGVTAYNWLTGTLQATFTDPAFGDACRGQLSLEADFGPAK